MNQNYWTHVAELKKKMQHKTERVTKLKVEVKCHGQLLTVRQTVPVQP